jgi:hypothetical protein
MLRHVARFTFQLDSQRMAATRVRFKSYRADLQSRLEHWHGVAAALARLPGDGFVNCF